MRSPDKSTTFAAAAHAQIACGSGARVGGTAPVKSQDYAIAVVDLPLAHTADVELAPTVTVRPGKQWGVERALNQRILENFDAHGIHAPCAALVREGR